MGNPIVHWEIHAKDGPKSQQFYRDLFDWKIDVQEAMGGYGLVDTGGGGINGGINGVKIAWEECDTGYATDRGVECYERLKGKGPTGAAYVIPLSTGITFALTEKAPVDKIPIISMGYGRSESRDDAARSVARGHEDAQNVPEHQRHGREQLQRSADMARIAAPLPRRSRITSRRSARG